MHDHEIASSLGVYLLGSFVAGMIAWRWGFVRPLSRTFCPKVSTFQLVSILAIYLGYLVVLPLVIQHVLWLGWLKPTVWSFVQCSISLSLLVTLTAYLSTEGKGVVAVRDIFRNGLFGVMALMIALPVVSLIHELCDLFLYLVYGFHGYEQVAVRFLRSSLGSPVQAILAVTSIVGMAPIIEEVVFRGVLQQYLKQGCPTWVAITITSLCFAACHFSPSQGLGNLPLLASLTLFALILGYTYERQQSLVAPIVLHAAFNSVNVIQLLRVSSGT